MLHRGAVRHIAFSPDGALLVTSGADRTLRLWSARTGEPLCQPMRMPGQVYISYIARGNRAVLAASNDGTVRLWSLHGTPDDPAKLMQLAQLMSNRQIDAVGGVVALSQRERARLAGRLHALQPILQR